MDGSLNQLMRLLANRGTEWLRQKILELPLDCPINHPDIGLLAKAGRIAPILTGLRGRISPLEVIVQRRLTPALTHQQIADMIGTSRETVTRAIKQLKGEGWLEQMGKRYVIPDAD